MSDKKKHTEAEADGNKWEKFSKEQDDTSEAKSAEPGEGAEELYGLGIEFPSRGDLENQLTAMERKVDDYKNQAIRAHAELDNVRKRAERDVTNAHKYSNEKLLNELLPVLDSLVRALEGLPAEDEALKNIRHGMVLTLELLEKTLTKFGVQFIDPAVGEPFNPAQHEAMSMQPHPDAAPNTIVQVLQRGYELHGRVLRAAMVIVAQ